MRPPRAKAIPRPTAVTEKARLPIVESTVAGTINATVAAVAVTRPPPPGKGHHGHQQGTTGLLWDRLMLRICRRTAKKQETVRVMCEFIGRSESRWIPRF